MPKMKTISSAKKRFKVTGTGKIKSKRALTNSTLVHEADMNNVKIMLRIK